MYANYYSRLFGKAWEMTKLPVGISGFGGMLFGILLIIITLVVLASLGQIKIITDELYMFIATGIALVLLIPLLFIVNCFRAAPYLYFDQQKKIDSLTEQLLSKQNKRCIRDKLSEFIIEGKKLIVCCDDETKLLPNDEVTLWEDNIIKFLRENLENSFIARFKTPSGEPINIPSTSTQHRELWNGIRFRLTRLVQFIEEYRD